MVGTTENAESVALTNTGSAALQIEGIKAESGFEVTSTCGASLAPNATSGIDASFSPAASEQVSRRVLVTDNAVGSPHTIQLTGSGGVNFPCGLPKGMQCPPSWPPCCSGLKCTLLGNRAFCE